MMTSENLDTRRADAQYRGFPAFRDWLAATSVDPVRWERYSQQLKQMSEATPELLGRAREVAKRAAAVDTGAIEGLYEVDRGFTFSVALQLATWEAQLDAKGARVRALIEAQMSAYDFVLDLATRREPVAEAWVRTLHEVICRSQETYVVHTEVGVQEQPLPLGAYKVLPNHVRRPNGDIHSYAPVDMVPQEMHRLIEELRSGEFERSHPVQQAAYVHYALVVIHPFADGNGRLARALASVFTYRALSVPLLILAEQRSEYYEALAEADDKKFQRFSAFVLARVLDSLQLVAETLRAAGAPTPGDAASGLRTLYRTKGGFTHAEVDSAGYKFFDAFLADLARQSEALTSGELLLSASANQTKYSVSSGDYRNPITAGPRMGEVVASSPPPAQASVRWRFTLEVPKDSGKDDDLRIRNVETGESLAARVTEALPNVAGTLQLRIAVYVHGVLGRLVTQLTKAARETLSKHGY